MKLELNLTQAAQALLKFMRLSVIFLKKLLNMLNEYMNEEMPDSPLPVEAPNLENMSAAERAAGVLAVHKGGTGSNNGSIRGRGTVKIST